MGRRTLRSAHRPPCAKERGLGRAVSLCAPRTSRRHRADRHRHLPRSGAESAGAELTGNRPKVHSTATARGASASEEAPREDPRHLPIRGPAASRRPTLQAYVRRERDRAPASAEGPVSRGDGRTKAAAGIENPRAAGGRRTASAHGRTGPRGNSSQSSLSLARRDPARESVAGPRAQSATGGVVQAGGRGQRRRRGRGRRDSDSRVANSRQRRAAGPRLSRLFPSSA